jgi:lactate permease
MYQQSFDPVAHSLAWSAVFASLPLLALFLLLGGLRWQARWAALTSLVVAIAVAKAIYRMPLAQSLAAAAEGASIGFFPIFWVAINAIWLFKLTEISGHSAGLRRAFDSVSTDVRIQSILIAFCFGSLMEALAGGGSPVAIGSVMLVALGIPPLKAAAVCLIADTSPVSFGSLGLPISTLAKITGVSVPAIAAVVGHQTPLLALFVPLILVYILDGKRGVRQTWPLATVAGMSFGVAQSLGSTALPLELVDIVAALFSTATCVAFLRLWSPSHIAHSETGRANATVAAPGSSYTMPESGSNLRGRELAYALLPYLAVVTVVALAQWPPLRALLARGTSTFAWPGLHVVDHTGALVKSGTARFEWLASGGSLVLLAGLMVAPFLGLGPRQIVRAYLENLFGLRWTIFTVGAVVGVAYVMNLSGEIITLGTWAAGAGRAFAAIASLIGWLGTAVTGSDTSSNALFGMLQVTTARHSGLPEVLLAAANTSGGVCGKTISPQNLSVAAVAVGLAGREGELFRRVVGWSVLMIAFLCILVFLQSIPVLSWMLR